MPRPSGRMDSKNEQLECSVVPFGLTTNAPASFSNMMMLRVLDPVLDKWGCLLSRLQDQGKAPAASPRRPLGKNSLHARPDSGHPESGAALHNSPITKDRYQTTPKRIPLCRVYCPPSFHQHHSLHMDRHTTSCIPSTQTSLPLRPRPLHLRPRPHPHRRHRCIQFPHRCSAAADYPTEQRSSHRIHLQEDAIT